MKNTGVLTKILAGAGTLLAWLPVLAPFIFGLAAYSAGKGFLFDYLIPAEIFPVALVGGGLLLWAAFRAKARRGLIGWGLGGAIALLVGGQALAEVTGLASGETAMGGWQWALVLTSLAGFWLALIAMGVGGALLLRDLLKADAPQK